MNETTDKTPQCGSCGREGDELTEVKRVYVNPDDPGSFTTVDEVEAWCPSCLATYPHRVSD